MVTNKYYFGLLVTKNPAYDLPQILSGLQERHSLFLTLLQNLELNKAALEQTDLIYAIPYWRPGKTPLKKYLYLNYPLQKGQPRRRKYIGADPENIKAAELGIERAQQYERLKAQISQLERDAATAKELLDQASWLLEKHI